MDEIVLEFKQESVELTEGLLETLEDLEGDFSKVKNLEQFGQIVDRIMGSARNVAMIAENPEYITNIANYAELCKVVGYKGSQIDKNESFFNIVVALLLDATEMLLEILQALGTDGEKSIKEYLNATFLDRLKWISEKFEENVRATVAVEKKTGQKASQSEIDDLLKNFGLG